MDAIQAAIAKARAARAAALAGHPQPPQQPDPGQPDTGQGMGQSAGQSAGGAGQSTGPGAGPGTSRPQGADAGPDPVSDPGPQGGLPEAPDPGPQPTRPAAGLSAAGGAANASPAAGAPLTGGPVTGGPVTGGPVAGGPVAGGPAPATATAGGVAEGIAAGIAAGAAAAAAAPGPAGSATERPAGGLSATPSATPLAAPPAAADAALQRRWQALPEFTPQPRLLARNHIVTAQGGRDSAPFDRMRTRLLQQMRANNWRRVAITSPGPGCGKSTIALNLALSLARQAEQRTVLAELDLRRPSLARLLGLRRPGTPPQDFPRVLDGRDPFAAQALRIGRNLAVSTCRGPVRNPAELLHSPAAAAALQQIEADYAPTVFLFDTSPVLLVDDAMAVMGQMDCALIVAAAETTRIAEIDRCERELASQTNVLGVVLNKCRYTEQGYDYGYYGG